MGTKPVKIAYCTKFRYKDTLSSQTGSGAKLKMAACSLFCATEDFSGSSCDETGSESE
jgi:hypothetical protein